MTVRRSPDIRPATAALLSIDALPVWGMQAPASRSTARPSAQPQEPGRSAMASFPDAVATAPGEAGGRSGFRPIVLGIAAGLCGICPFLDLRPPSSSGTPRSAARHPAASIEPVSLITAVQAATLVPEPTSPFVPAHDVADLAVPIPVETVREAQDAVAVAPSIVQARLVTPTDAGAIAPAMARARSADEIPAPESPKAPMPVARSTSDHAPQRPRIVIHYSADGGRPAAEVAARRLHREGASGIALRQVPFPIRQKEIRVFSPRDSARAANLASAAGGGGRPLRVVDFRHYRPAPSGGLVEIWVR